MTLERTRYDLVFEVKSLLHVGAGEVDVVSFKTNKDGKAIDQIKEVSLVTKDKNGFPWISGSTLKGAFRAAARDLKLDSTSILFGAAKSDGASSNETDKGALSFSGAVSCSENSNNTLTRMAQSKRHSGTMASESNKLFTKEYVVEGEKFKTSVWVRATDEGIESGLLNLLNAFATASGRSIGANKSDRMGSLCLTNATKFTETLSVTGWADEKIEEITLDPSAEKSPKFSLDLSCPGPYLTQNADSSQTQSGKENAISGLVDRDGNPRILPSSVSGYLRARASWLMELELAKTNPKYGFSKASRVTGGGRKDLTVIDRLFGCEGYRGSLDVEIGPVNLDVEIGPVTKEGPYNQTSVALDPITHAPFTSALFTFNAHYGIRSSLKLFEFRDLDDDELALLDLLSADLKQNGLKLGMGVAKGFGWFNCAPSERTNASYDKPSAKESEHDQSTFPHQDVTLPYRLIDVQTDVVGMPPQAVQAAATAQTLHSTPLKGGGYSGHIDLSWCFDVPMLCGALDPESNEVGPIKYGDTYVIPGSTLRGAIRNVLDIVTSARLRQVNAVSDASADKADSFPLKSRLEKLEAAASQKVGQQRQLNSSFKPDFVEALFGFAHDGAGLDHDLLHLKSRVDFGFASLKTDCKEDSVARIVKLASPNVTSKIYSHLGRKRYFSDATDTDTIFERLKASTEVNPKRGAEPEKMDSKLKFLQPVDSDTPLGFRSRVSFHNLDAKELGALLWAFTCDEKTNGRHKIGRAKAFGAGRCYVRDVELDVTSQTMPVGQSLAGGHNGQEGPKGISDFAKQFETYLNENRLFNTRAKRELEASFDYTFGQAMREKHDLPRGSVGYQTWDTLKKRKVIKGIKETNGGRVAAMMAKESKA